MSAPFGVNMTLISGWSYEEVGEVIELGSAVQVVSMGDIIFCRPCPELPLGSYMPDPHHHGPAGARRPQPSSGDHACHPVQAAAQGFQILDNTPDEALQVVLDFSHE